MSRETIKNLIDMIDEKDIDTIYKVILKFIPEVSPDPDEIEAIAAAKADRSATILHEDSHWD